MYKRILVAIENSAADRTILTHVTELAQVLRNRPLSRRRLIVCSKEIVGGVHELAFLAKRCSCATCCSTARKRR